MDNPFAQAIARVDELERQMPSQIRLLLEGRSDDLLDMLQEQMGAGQAASGDDIRPYYTEDNYFKSRESAERYADWKESFMPNNRRNRLAPNLYINGKFWSEIAVRFGANEFVFYGGTQYAQGIFQKYGADQLDLTRQHLDELGNDLVPQLDTFVTNLLRGR